MQVIKRDGSTVNFEVRMKIRESCMQIYEKW